MTSGATVGRPPVEDAALWAPAAVDGVTALSAHYHRHYFRPHAHEGYLLGVIEKGAHAVWCRGSLTRAGAGTLASFNPGEAHHGGSATDRGWSQRMLYVSRDAMAELMEDGLDRPCRSLPTFRDCFRVDRRAAAQFVELHRLLANEADRLACRAAFDRVVTDLMLRYGGLADRFSSSRAPARNVDRAREYLHDHLAERVTLDELASVVGLRRRQLIEGFKRHFGLSPHQYLIQARIQTSHRLILRGLPLAEVALAVGFADQSHFIRHFKAILGVTPARYQAGI